VCPPFTGSVILLEPDFPCSRHLVFVSLGILIPVVKRIEFPRRSDCNRLSLTLFPAIFFSGYISRAKPGPNCVYVLATTRGQPPLLHDIKARIILARTRLGTSLTMRSTLLMGTLLSSSPRPAASKKVDHGVRILLPLVTERVAKFLSGVKFRREARRRSPALTRGSGFQKNGKAPEADRFISASRTNQQTLVTKQI